MTKEFIGVKRVTAWPQDGKDGQPGYAVKYADGYISWSPKDVFEAAYFPLADATGTKISESDVDAFLLPPEGSQLDPKTTIVRQDTITGFVQYDVSSCVDPANYDHALGVSIATKRIRDRIWPMLGFVLQWANTGLKPHTSREGEGK